MRQVVTVHYGNKHFKKREETFRGVTEVTYQQGYEVLRLVKPLNITIEIPMQNIAKVVFSEEETGGSDASG